MRYPVGPDDAGNAVMHGVGLVVSGWRWITSKFTNRSRGARSRPRDIAEKVHRYDP